jgi:hypothetical protein
VRARIVLSLFAGGAALLAAMQFPRLAMLSFPGLLIAAVFWPRGIHSNFATGTFGVTMFIATLYLGTIAFWAGVTYAILRVARRRK